MDSMDIPDVANVEVIGFSPSGSSVLSDDFVYEELQCIAQTEFKGYTYAGKSPDQGYESDSVCQVAYGNGFPNEVSSGHCEYYENILIAEVLTSTATSYNYSSSPVFASANTPSIAVMPGSGSFGSIKVEPSEDLTGWLPVTSASFTDILPSGISALDFIDLTDTSQSIEESHQTLCGAQPAIDSDPAHQMTYVSHQPLTIKGEQHRPPPTAQSYNCSVVQSGPVTDLEISDDEGMEEIHSPNSKEHDEATRVAPKRRRKSTKQPILWKFLLDALNNFEQYGHMIHWVNIEEGTFQFTSQHKEELSKQWGLAKRNRCMMTYQKMARAMRNYINRGEVLRKVKKKLQYTFLPDFYETIKDRVLR